MKGYELIKVMPNMKLGTKIRRINDGQIYKLEKVECTKERKFSRIGNKKAVERFMTYKNMHRDFEVIEENKEIEELNDTNYNCEEMSIEETNCYNNLTRTKLNEVIRAVNKINKKLEELEPPSEISEEEINDAIKRAREYIEREEK